MKRKFVGRALALGLSSFSALVVGCGSSDDRDSDSSMNQGGATNAAGALGSGTGTVGGSAISASGSGGAPARGGRGNNGTAGTSANVPSGCTSSETKGLAHPFGSHAFAYPPGSIKPTGSPAELDQATAAFYQKWKAIYLDQTECSEGTHVVFHHFLHGRGATVSEAMGYGMVILPLMAGCDPDAQTVYDSMVGFVKAHTNANGLLVWKQLASAAPGGICEDDATDSATDGDLDVAFSYLLADKQWGSAGSVNYLELAQSLLSAIKAHEIVSGTPVTNLGDVAEEDTSRPSDWMLDHFRAFAKVDPFFTQVVDKTYDVVTHVQQSYSSQTGLLPDYVLAVSSADPHPAAAGAEVQESTFTDSEVAYNSCRVPWHLGTDYLASGDARAKTAADKINNWIKTATGGDPSKIIDGYKLDGTPGSLDPAEYAPDPPEHGQSLAFTAPFAVCAMTSAEHQVWLDSLWKAIVIDRPDIVQDDDYYGNTIKLLDLIILSGNWWQP